MNVDVNGDTLALTTVHGYGTGRPIQLEVTLDSRARDNADGRFACQHYDPEYFTYSVLTSL